MIATVVDRLEQAAVEVQAREEFRRITERARGKPLIRLRPTEREEIVKMYESGMTMQRLIEASGYPPAILRRELLAAGILIRGRGYGRKVA